ncbi:MAG: type II toxin-antitoxin system HicA family toxin [Bryobacteraceae bacterium]
MDSRGLRSLTARELIAALERDGFSFVRQTGSHQRYRHPRWLTRNRSATWTRGYVHDQNTKIHDRVASWVDGRRPQTAAPSAVGADRS